MVARYDGEAPLEDRGLFAWLHNYRRVVTRWEHYVENYPAWCSSPARESCSARL